LTPEPRILNPRF